jgi:hypothetical protein
MLLPSMARFIFFMKVANFFNASQPRQVQRPLRGWAVQVRFREKAAARAVVLETLTKMQFN